MKSVRTFYESGFYEDCIFVLLQVTSPLRTGEQIKEAMNMYLQGTQKMFCISMMKGKKE